jgi:hypothetical protein
MDWPIVYHNWLQYLQLHFQKTKLLGMDSNELATVMEALACLQSRHLLFII